LGPWGAAIGGIGGAVVCGYLAYTATS
ncbi:bacteriocin BlpN, partial [Streptococcus pneumoniae]|nr:bacteriocin BlpN [Streptococcus pneumoniae]MDG8313601.1 bacteriocin BlpN [Streptococcus pneumoniae]